MRQLHSALNTSTSLSRSGMNFRWITIRWPCQFQPIFNLSNNLLQSTKNDYIQREKHNTFLFVVQFFRKPMKISDAICKNQACVAQGNLAEIHKIIILLLYFFLHFLLTSITIHYFGCRYISYGQNLTSFRKRILKSFKYTKPSKCSILSMRQGFPDCITFTEYLRYIIRMIACIS